MNITDLEFVENNIDDNGSYLTFRFSEITSGNIGGYNIYVKYNLTEIFTYETFVIDSSANSDDDVIFTYNEDGYTYFNYYINDEDFGKTFFISVAPVLRTWVEDGTSNIVEVIAPPHPVLNLKAYYGNNLINISWEDDPEANSNVIHYAIRRSKGKIISNLSVADNGDLYSTEFYYGTNYLIVDKVKKVYWYGSCQNNNRLSILNTNMFPYVLDTADEYEMSINNVVAYSEEEFETISTLSKVPLQTSYIYEDDIFDLDSVYFYSVVPYSSSSISGSAVAVPLIIRKLDKLVPYLRSIGNSENTYLSSPFWRNMKNVLVDNNYYLKQQFDIPKIKGNYSFKGFLGFAFCYVDIFVNGTYALSVETDNYGNFEFDLPFRNNVISLSLQGRDKNNIHFSIKSTPQIIRLVNIYTFFAVLANSYTDMWEEILRQFDDFSFSTSRLQLLSDKLSPFVDFIKNIDEEDDSYRNVLIASYLAYEYAGYQKAIYMILDSFKENVPECSDYLVFFNDFAMDTLKSRYTFSLNNKDLVSTSTTRLERGHYVYGVSACTYAGEESSISIIHADSRWWPNESLLDDPDSYYGYNIIFWDEVGEADFYKVYRLDNPSYYFEYNIADFSFLQECQMPILMDFGLNPLQPSVNPPKYTITEFSKPQNLKVYYNNFISDVDINIKNKNWIRILIFENRVSELKDYQIGRLLSMFKDLIPPELGYTILLCNDYRVKDITFLDRPNKEIQPLPNIHYRCYGDLISGVYYQGTFVGPFSIVRGQPGFRAYNSLNYNEGFYSYTAFFQSDLIEKAEGISQIILMKNSSSDFCKVQYTKLELNSFGIWWDFEHVLGTNMMRAFIIGLPKKIQIRVLFKLPNLYEDFSIRLHTLA